MTGDLDSAFGILMDSGAVIVGADDKQVVIAMRGFRPLNYEVVVTARVDSNRLAADRAAAAQTGRLLLYVVERMTDELRHAARDDAVSFIALRERLCSIGGRIWPAPESEPSRPKFRLWALGRVLLSTSTPLLQGVSSNARTDSGGVRSSLSDLIGVSQPHVSTLLRQLPKGSVELVTGGWVVKDFDRLWRWHTSVYPGPGGVRFAWHSPRGRASQLEQLKKVVSDAAAALSHGRKASRTLLSGFEAVPVPLRGSEIEHPTDPRTERSMNLHGPVTVFSKYLTSTLTQMQYTRCPPEFATVQLVQPADTTLYQTAAAWGDAGRTDPLITAWELTHGSSRDHGQALALRDWARAYRQTSLEH